MYGSSDLRRCVAVCRAGSHDFSIFCKRLNGYVCHIVMYGKILIRFAVDPCFKESIWSSIGGSRIGNVGQNRRSPCRCSLNSF